MGFKGLKDFELRLGKLGLTVFVVGVAVLIFLSFQLGMIVGKNIDTYPEQMSGGLPAFIKQKIVRKSAIDPGAAAKKEAPEADAGAGKDVNLTFYDTLGGKKPRPELQQNRPPEPAAPPPAAVVPAAPVLEKVPPAREKPVVKGSHFVQVVSFKNEKKAEALRKSLSGLGYHCEVDTTEAAGGKFYRVKLTGFETREDAVKAANAVEKKTSLKCIVLGPK